MKIAHLEASTFEFLASSHENKMKFKGLLVMLDEPSTKAPNGSNGHRILIPKSVAEKNLSTLIGMGLNYTSELDAHAPKHKVGVIEKAWIQGNQLWVQGVVWKKDFPEAEKDLKQPNLGMSFEASDISVENTNADIWKITDLCFTGATILYKKAAAYSKTQAIAAQAARAAEPIKNLNGGKSMSDKKKKHAAKTSDRVSASAGKNKMSIEDALATLIDVGNKNTKAIYTLAASTEKAITELANSRVEAAEDNDESADESVDAAADSATESSDAEEVSAAKKSSSSTESDDDDDDVDAAKGGTASSSSSDDMDADADDDGKLAKMKKKEASENDAPGKLNEKAKNKGDQTTVEASSIRKLQKSVKRMEAENKELRKKLEKTKVQLKAAGERTERRSMTASVQLKNLLSKSNVDIDTMHASDTKASVEEFDAMIQAAGISDVRQRIALKNEAARLDIMDPGYVTRG